MSRYQERRKRLEEKRSFIHQNMGRKLPPPIVNTSILFCIPKTGFFPTMTPLVERVSRTICEMIFAYRHNETSARQLPRRCCFSWFLLQTYLVYVVVLLIVHDGILDCISAVKHGCRPSALCIFVNIVPRRTIRSNCGRWSAIKRICLTSSFCCGKPPV